MIELDALLQQRLERLPPDTTCFRWVDHEIPGITVDLFGPVAVMSLYREDIQENALADALLKAPGVSTVYVKRRPPEARKFANALPEVVAPLRPLLGEPVDVLRASECGLRFNIRPSNGLSVGLYLDARDARSWVRREARGRRVLNAFAYTCGFGVAALAGQAKRVVNLDASRKVLDWGVTNYELNSLSTERYDFISGDAFDWLTRFAKKNEAFDLIVLDPPGFATTKTSRFTASRDYHRLVHAAVSILEPNGVLLAMCNVAQSSRDFEIQLERGLGPKKARIATRFGASAVDFRQPSALQCVVLELTPTIGPRS